MAKALLLVGLCLLIASCFTVYGVEVDTVSSSIAMPPRYPPVMAPNHAPAHAPVDAPAHAPVDAPAHPPYHLPRSLVEVQGVVYCKSCKYAGADTLLEATPVLGASVKLQCNNSKHPQNMESKTDGNGYFRIKAPKNITSFGADKCKVFLVSSPSASCKKPSTLNSGSTGAALRPYSVFATKPPVALYIVGPLAFEPKCRH